MKKAGDIIENLNRHLSIRRVWENLWFLFSSDAPERKWKAEDWPKTFFHNLGPEFIFLFLELSLSLLESGGSISVWKEIQLKQNLS